jgi:5-methylcytosine-specific restriction endonuclease McrA
MRHKRKLAYHADLGQSRATSRARNHSHAEEHRAAQKSWRQRNPEAAQTASRNWIEANREHVREYNRVRYHMRKRGADDLAIEYGNILVRDPCSYCGSTRNLVRDHIVPVQHGGDGSFTNLTSSCNTCNLIKSDRKLLSFLLFL